MGKFIGRSGKGKSRHLKHIVSIAKPPKAHLEMWFTYNDLHEAGEINRRELPLLSVEYIKNTLCTIYKSCGIDIFEIDIVSNEDLKKFDTQWSKRLGFGRARDVFRIKAIIKNNLCYNIFMIISKLKAIKIKRR